VGPDRREQQTFKRTKRQKVACGFILFFFLLICNVITCGVVTRIVSELLSVRLSLPVLIV